MSHPRAPLLLHLPIKDVRCTHVGQRAACKQRVAHMKIDGPHVNAKKGGRAHDSERAFATSQIKLRLLMCVSFGK